MSDAGYWVNISRSGSRLGAGFLLMGSYVLTAHHCLGRATPGNEDVEVEFESGEVLPGRVHRRSPAADLALIDVPKSGRGPVIPRADRASAGEAWRNPYRPGPSHAFLSGMVDAAPIIYRCEGEDGESVEAMQLGCTQDLGDYAGYSGSPIEGSGPDGAGRLLGVLIEQYPEHFPPNSLPRPASVVLFAATLSEVFRRFDCFDVGHLIDLLPSSPGGGAPVPCTGDDKPPAGGSMQNDARSRIADTDAMIEALDAWQKRGLLDEQRITALKMRVIERQLLGDDWGERS
jgi:hypothetical protein